MYQLEFVCQKESRKFSFILEKFVVTTRTRENRVTSNFKGRNHIPSYLDITENFAQCVWFWNKISKEKDHVYTVQMQKAQLLCSEGL